MSTQVSDRVQKQVTIKAPVHKVWQAIASPRQFGAWFGARLEGEFKPGAEVAGPLTIEGFEHLTLVILVERVEPERLFSFRWHPNAVEADIDYSTEPMTLVEFMLEESGDGTLLTIVESGFDRIPLHRRAEAFWANDEGWAMQADAIREYCG